jgi:hypothetical protein
MPVHPIILFIGALDLIGRDPVCMMLPPSCRSDRNMGGRDLLRSTVAIVTQRAGSHSCYGNETYRNTSWTIVEWLSQW